VAGYGMIGFYSIRNEMIDLRVNYCLINQINLVLHDDHGDFSTLVFHLDQSYKPSNQLDQMMINQRIKWAIHEVESNSPRKYRMIHLSD